VAREPSKHLRFMRPVNPTNHPRVIIILMSQKQKWGPRKIHCLAQHHTVVSGKARIWTWQWGPQGWAACWMLSTLHNLCVLPWKWGQRWAGWQVAPGTFLSSRVWVLGSFHSHPPPTATSTWPHAVHPTKCQDRWVPQNLSRPDKGSHLNQWQRS
jgi:hypothetical protein